MNIICTIPEDPCTQAVVQRSAVQRHNVGEGEVCGPTRPRQRIQGLCQRSRIPTYIKDHLKLNYASQSPKASIKLAGLYGYEYETMTTDRYKIGSEKDRYDLVRRDDEYVLVSTPERII